MPYIVTNPGERIWLSNITSYGQYVGLYVNNFTPTPTMTFSSITECSDMDYTSYGYRQNLSFGSSSTVGGVAQATATTVTYNFNPDIMMMRTPFTVYGYFVTNDNTMGYTSGDIIMAELFPSPFYIDAGTTQAISIPIKLKLHDENS